MNELHVVLWILVATLPLALIVSVLPWLERLRSARARRVTTAVLTLMLLAPITVSAAGCLYLCLGAGLDHGPWLGATLACLGQAAGSLWLLRHAARAAQWPRVPFAIAVPLLSVLLWTVRVNLDLAAANSGLAMQLEAGRIAYRETPPPVEPESNAAPRYEALIVKLGLQRDHRAERVGRPDQSEPAFRAEWLNPSTDIATLAAADSDARAALARHAADLAALRDAARLPRCRFEPRDEPARFASTDVVPLLDLARILVLDARLRAHDGDAAGALEDLATAMALADHAEETPTLIAMMTASSVRSTTLRALPAALAAGGLSKQELARFPLDSRRDPLAVHERAFFMEEAFFLDSLGRAHAESSLSFALLVEAPGEWLESPGAYFALRLTFDAEVAGYRRALAALREAPRLSPEALRARLESKIPAHERYRDGVLAGLFAPKQDAILRAELHGAALRELARALIAAAIFRAEHGAWPAQASDLGPLPPGVRWEGDATRARFTSTDPLFAEDPVSLAIP